MNKLYHFKAEKPKIGIRDIKIMRIKPESF